MYPLIIVPDMGELSFGYDAVGNITTITDDAAFPGYPQTQTFTYDALDRLLSAQAAGGPDGAGDYGPESYGYDPTTGSLASKAGVSCTYGDAQHKHAVTGLSNGSSFSYDANGSMITRNIGRQTFNLSYDAENRMTGVTGAATANFVYDDTGARVIATEGVTTTVYVGSYFEWHGTITDTVKYYYANTVRVAMRKGDGQPLFLLGDHLGSTNRLVHADGTPVTPGGMRLYKAWGESRYEPDGELATDYRYTGQFEQQSIGLYYYGARWYDAYINRFASPDTLVPDYYNPLDWDRYQYVRSSPIKYNDPTGHMQVCADGDEGGGCGRGANTEEIYETFDKEHGGRWDGLFAEFYALLHEARLAISRDDPLAPELVNSAASAYTRAVSWIPQKDINISNLTTSFGPSSIYQIAKFLTDLGGEFVSAGVAGLSTTFFPAPKGSKGTYLSPFGYPTNPSQPPASGWVWRGNGPPGSNKGNWVNPETGEWIHLDINHHGEVHFDYGASDGTRFWLWSDGSMTPK